MPDQKFEMIPTPLPTEVPTPPNLDQLPLEILHSATVEMLIQQNEDLSSRLKVNIRRNSILEQRILEFEKRMQLVAQQKDNLEAQNQIIKERESIWQEKKQEKDHRLEALEKEVQLLDLRYNELRTTSQYKYKEVLKQLSDQQQRSQDFEKKLALSHKIKERAKERLREFLYKTAVGMNAEHTKLQLSSSQQRMLQKNFDRLKSEFAEKEIFFKEQLQKLKDASLKNIQMIQEDNQSLKAQNESLVEKNTELNQELADMKLKYFEEKKMRAKVSQQAQELSELKNERVRLKRELLDSQEKFAESLGLEQSRVTKSQKDLQATQLQMSEQKQALDVCENKLIEISKDNRGLAQQLESLQKLWVHAQESLEKEQARSKALEKINRELSQQNNANKVQRAVESARPLKSGSTTSEDIVSPAQEKLSQVYAGQYRNLNRPPKMDL